MPLTTVRWQQGRNWNEAPVREFLALAARDPMFPVPYPVARSMLEEDATRPTDGLSATTLLKGCVRCKVLERYEPFTLEVPGDIYYRWKGSMFHMVLEHFMQEGAEGEVRFYTKLPGSGSSGPVIHGKPDLILPSSLTGTASIVDGKTTKKVPLYGNMWPNHEQQLNIYRWLINNAESADDPSKLYLKDEEFKRLVIWYMDPDHIKVIEATKSYQVATKPGAKSAFKTVREPYIWSDEEVEAFISVQYDELASAFDMYETQGLLPPYPPDFDPFRSWEHAYSPVAHMCVRLWAEDVAAGRKAA